MAGVPRAHARGRRSRRIARDAVAAGRLAVLSELQPAHAGVYALYQDGASAELARRAVGVLVEHVRASRWSVDRL